MYRKAKRDKNEQKIVNYLRRCGASVCYLDAPGVPDLAVGYKGKNDLWEIKGKHGKLTPPQEDFFETWMGSCKVIRTVHEAKLALKGLVKMPRVIRVYVCPEDAISKEKKEDMGASPEPPLCPVCERPMVQVYQSEINIIYRGNGWTGGAKESR